MKEESEEARRRRRARQRISNALARGHLERPGTCERCGIGCKPEASHSDYSKPLDIEWLCRPCHEEKDLLTHCKRGHEFTPENTRMKRNVRLCKECSRIHCRAYAARKKAA